MGKAMVCSFVCMVFVVTCCNSAQAGPRGKRNVSRHGQFSFQLESNGRSLPTYNHRGRTYIEGTHGSPYQIRVFNHSGERAEVVVTVDGRDVVTGQQGNYRTQRGYVIAPYNSVLIEGFRTSFRNVAQFSFTDVGDSYAARMGDARNVGVIGVAVFTEKRYRRRPRPQPLAESEPPAPRRDRRRAKRGYGGSESSASKAPSVGGYGTDDGYAPREEYRRQGIGTRYGGSKYSPVESTRFVRRRAYRPDHLLAVRYDDRQGLIDKGIIPVPRPAYRRPIDRPNPFPHSPGQRFAPPPPPAYYYEQ